MPRISRQKYLLVKDQGVFLKRENCLSKEFQILALKEQ